MPDAIYYFDWRYQQEFDTHCVGEKWEELVWNEPTDEIFINRENLQCQKEFINVFLTLMPSRIICTIGRYYFLPSPSWTFIVLVLLAVEMSAKCRLVPQPASQACTSAPWEIKAQPHHPSRCVLCLTSFLLSESCSEFTSRAQKKCMLLLLLHIITCLAAQRHKHLFAQRMHKLAHSPTSPMPVPELDAATRQHFLHCLLLWLL